MSPDGLLSWGNYPRCPQTPWPCHWRGDLAGRLHGLQQQFGTTLPFGAGRSYGDSCLAASDQVLAMRPLARFISADWNTGAIVAESGVSLADILVVAIPRGWFLPVTPGTRFVTLGGAIANDVHGKNHHQRGSFGLHVRRFGLLCSDQGAVICSAAEHPELYAATIGGLGLTGVIEWAEIQLLPIRSSRIVSVTQRFDRLDDFFVLSAERDAQHEFSVSWIDCAARAGGVGRGIHTVGDFAAEGPLTIDPRRELSFPFTPARSLVTGRSLRLFNELYWHKASPRATRSLSGYSAFLYPLDSILHWNRVYGRSGFQQYQCLIPEHDAREGIRTMLTAIADAGSGSFLTVLKRCGSLPSPGYLSFPQTGITLALDFPQDDALSTELFPRLDAIVRETGGRLYPAKDAHMSGEDFRRSYPRWQQLEALRDPALLSRFWQRVTS
jgi:FAD/FMN-containing dehydrogenase